MRLQMTRRHIDYQPFDLAHAASVELGCHNLYVSATNKCGLRIEFIEGPLDERHEVMAQDVLIVLPAERHGSESIAAVADPSD